MENQKKEEGKVTTDQLERAHKTPITPLEKWFADLLPDIFAVYGLRTYSVSYSTVSRPVQVEDGEVMLEVSYQKSYHAILLKIHHVAYEMWANKEYDELIDGLIHEVAHIITIPLAELALERFVSKKEVMQANEEATESVAVVVRKLLRITNPELFKVKQVKK